MIWTAFGAASPAQAAAPTTTALASSLNPSTVGQAVTFTATVTPGAATGSVTFTDGLVALGTVPLAAGQATFTTATLLPVPHSVTATYNGDVNFIASTSAPLAQTVNPDFALSAVEATTGSSTVAVGEAATFTVTVTPATGGFSNPVTLSAPGLPPGATATFNPTAVAPGLTPATSLMTIQTSGSARPATVPPPAGPLLPLALGAALLLGMRAVSGRRRRRAVALSLGIALFVPALLSGCGAGTTSGPGVTPLNAYTVTIAGTSGTTMHTTAVPLTVK